MCPHVIAPSAPVVVAVGIAVAPVVAAIESAAPTVVDVVDLGDVEIGPLGPSIDDVVVAAVRTVVPGSIGIVGTIVAGSTAAGTIGSVGSGDRTIWTLTLPGPAWSIRTTGEFAAGNARSVGTLRFFATVTRTIRSIARTTGAFTITRSARLFARKDAGSVRALGTVAISGAIRSIHSWSIGA
jgi:hypothetical protein